MTNCELFAPLVSSTTTQPPLHAMQWASGRALGHRNHDVAHGLVGAGDIRAVHERDDHAAGLRSRVGLAAAS
jgi:hypothetical protein